MTALLNATVEFSQTQVKNVFSKSRKCRVRCPFCYWKRNLEIWMIWICI